MIEELDGMIAGLDQLIDELTSMTPPRDAEFLITSRGVLRGLRDDWVHGCSREHVREQIAKIREIVDSKGAELGITFPRRGRE